MSGGKIRGRSPADKARAGRQQMWEAIKKTPTEVTVAAVVSATGVHRETATRYLKALAEAGVLELTHSEFGFATVWKLEKDSGHHAPRVRADGTAVTQGDILEQLWRGMNILKDFNFRDLVATASISISEATARDYCKRLLAAGYLRVLRKANPALEQVATYRLIRRSGPLPPKIQRVQQVYDPNTGKVYGLGDQA